MVAHRIRMRHLRCFLAVARTGSVTRAAEDMGVVQPSVSRSIRELEEAVGKPLFTRTSKGVLLSADGQILFSHVADGLGHIDHGLEALHNLTTEQRVVAYILPNVVRTIMPEAILRFKKVFPHVDVRMPAATGGGWQQHIRDENADFAFGRLFTPKQMEGMSFEHLFDEPLAFFVQAGHPLAERVDIHVEEIDHYPVILPLRGTIIREEIDRFLISKGKQRFRNQIETLSFEFARNFVAASDAVVCLPMGGMRREVSEGSIRQLDFARDAMSGPVGLSYPTGRRTSATAEVLMQSIRDVVRERADHDALI